jgi:hypothetical protein
VASDAGATFLAPGEPPAVFAGSAALAPDGGGALLMRKEGLLALDAAGRPGAATSFGAPVVIAACRAGDALVIGRRDGTIEAVPPGARFQRPTDSFVTRLVAGPSRTLVAGYADGTIAVLGLDDGAVLATARLLGRVDHLEIAGRRLVAASDGGGVLARDLGVFEADACALLREVWARIPVVWEGGAVVPRPPPADHRCAPVSGRRSARAAP